MLRDVGCINLSTSILGSNIKLPICIAPTAMQKMAHPDGEMATARGNFDTSVRGPNPYSPTRNTKSELKSIMRDPILNGFS